MNLVDLHLNLKNFSEAIQYSEKVIEVAKDINDKKRESYGYLMKGEIYGIYMGEYQSSLTALKEALRISNENDCIEIASFASFYLERVQSLDFSKKNNTEAAILHAKKAVESFTGENKNPLLDTLKHLIDLLLNLKNYPEAIQYSEKIIEVAKDINDRGRESHGYLIKGHIYGICLDDYQSSLSALNEALQTSNENNCVEMASLASFYLERVKSLDYSKKNDIEAAIFHAKKAVEICTGRENKYLLLKTLQQLIDLLLNLKKYPEAIQYSDKVIEVAKDINDKKRESYGYIVKGHINGIFLGQYQSSLSDLNEALRISNENYCIESSNLASFYLERVQSLDFYKKNKTKEAILHARKAVELFTGENKYLLLGTLEDLADMLLSLKNYPEAIKCSEEVIEVAKVINDKEWEFDGYIMKADVYGQSGAYNSCCLALNKAIRISKESNDDIEAIRNPMARKIANKKGIEKFVLNSEDVAKYDQHESKSLLMETLDDLIPLYCLLNQYSEALQLAENILKVASDDTQDECWKFKGFFKKGVVYLQLGDHAAALSSFEEALRNAKKCKICESELNQVFLLQEVCQFYLKEYHEPPKSCENLPPLGYLTNFTEALQELVSQLPSDELDLSSPRVLIDMFESLLEKKDQFDLVSFLTELIYLNPQYLLSSLEIFMTNMDMDSKKVGSGFNKLLQSPMLLKYILKIVESVVPNSANEMKMFFENTDVTTNILEKFCSVVTSQKDQHRQDVNLPQLSLINQIVSNYSLGRFEVSEKLQTLSLTTLENTVRTLASEDHKISLTQQYLDTYKVRFKHLNERKCYYDAFWVAERCRAKELKFHREIEEKDINFSDIESYILERNCGILFYIWCFEDLFIYSIYKGKDDQGKDKVVVEMFHQNNYKTHLESLIRGVWCQISGCSMRQQPALSRTADDEDDKHEAYCCSMRAGPPSENVCHNFSDTNSEDDSVQNPYEELYELLIQPVGLEADELVIIPEGSLYLLPFPALQHPKTKHYLSQDKKLRFSPSMTTLLSHQSFPEDYYARSGSLIIGNPNVDQIEGMEPLSGAQKEAEAIADIIGGVMPLIGPRATKSAVLKRLFDVCIAHFACHIKLNPSAIVLSPEGSSQHVDDESYLLNPEDIMEKGIHARLVVLSGCNSGRGKMCAEGVVGIARAFLASGAAAVLVSRWRVNDYSTCEFMTIFYTYFLDWDVRRSASESLHLTINDMITKYPHEPKKWSGFYLMGDDVTIDRESLSVLQTKREPPASRSREPCECDE